MKSLIVINLILASSLAWSQDAGVDRFTIPFSDASRPGTLRVNLVNGSISVRVMRARRSSWKPAA